jgi:hypothetical protein
MAAHLLRVGARVRVRVGVGVRGEVSVVGVLSIVVSSK